MNLNFTLILQVISFLILLTLLTKFLYKPFKKYLEDRARRAENLIESARAAEEKAKSYADQTRQALEAAKNEALEMKDKTKRLADKERLDTINQTKIEAHHLLEEAKRQIAKAEKDATKRIRSKIGDLSLDIASKILAREIKKRDHAKLIDESIEEIENG